MSKINDYEFRWLNENSKKYLEGGYLVNGETTQDRLKFIAQRAEDILKIEGFADKFYSYMAKGYYSLSSPIWSNFGLKRGLPISCFGSYLGDTMGDILHTQAEVGLMSKFGGGASGFFGDLRPRGSVITNNGTSSGAVHFMQLYETLVDVISQGSVRRGHFSPYLPLEHPDVKEFLKIGTEGNPIQKLTHGVTVTDEWLKEMIAGDTEKREIWAEVIQRRNEMGYPYIMFTDNVNNGTVDVYKDKGMKIHASNMCFTGDTIVNLGEKKISIKELAKDSQGEKTFITQSLNIENDYIENKTTIAFCTGLKDIITLQFSDTGTIRCTKNHKFLLKDKTWCEAQDLLNKELYNTEVKVINILDSNEKEYVYDLTVEDNHNFFIDSGMGTTIVVHNCTEIFLPSSIDESFVCDLSSMNILYYDEWKDTDAVETLIYFLDAVMTEFIEKLEAYRDSDSREDNNNFRFLIRAYNFAIRHRALGLGVVGWHSYLQSKMIPFEDFEAMNLNSEIFKLLYEKSYKASKELAELYGEPEILKGYGRRNTTLLAVAPTTSSAFILGQVSQSIEPWWSNCYVKDLAKIKTTIKNTALEKLLEEKGKNDRETWNSIRDRDGSVQHLDFLSRREKDVFKTFSEINQYVIIDQAADRQKYIDQGQSLNLMIHPKTPVKEINALYIDAWKQGIKSLYYQHSKSAAQELTRKIVCAGCEG